MKMRRPLSSCAVGLAALAIGAAGLPPNTPDVLVATNGLSANRPSAKPAAPAPGQFTAAPVPNVDILGPTTRASNAPSVAPGLFSTRNAYQGEGYVPGSTVQTEQEKKLRPTPGVNLSVPLQ